MDSREASEWIMIGYWADNEPTALQAGDVWTLANCHRWGRHWRRRRDLGDYAKRVCNLVACGPEVRP